MDEPKSIEVTKEMIQAGADILSHWKHYETDFVSESQTVEDIYRAMAAISATGLPQRKQDQNNH